VRNWNVLFADWLISLVLFLKNYLGLQSFTFGTRPLFFDMSDSADLNQTLLGIVRRFKLDDAEFCPEQWLTEWLQTRIPALGGRRPAEFLGSPEGIERIANHLARIEHGVYS